MKLKTIVILLIVFGILASVSYLVVSRQESKNRNSEMGEKLFSNLPVDKISSITIQSTHGNVILKNTSSIWVVENKLNYFADFSLITQFVYQLTSSKIGRSFEASPESILRLGLISPEEKEAKDEQKGIQVTIADDEGTVLEDFIIGKSRRMTVGSGGHYIMLLKTSTIYLVDKLFDDLKKTPKEWIKKDLIDINEKDVEKITCYSSEQKPLYTLIRLEKDADLTFVDIPEDQKLDTAIIDDILTTLSPLSIEDVVGRSDDNNLLTVDYTLPFEYRLFNGTVYRVTPGKSPVKSKGPNEKDTNQKDSNKSKYYIRVKVDQNATIAKTGDDELSSLEDHAPINRDSMNQTIGNWVYEIPEWKFERFITNPENLFEKKE